MTDETSPKEIARRARLKAALRENLKRRKSQSKGRGAGAIVTPDDEAGGHEMPDRSPRDSAPVRDDKPD